MSSTDGPDSPAMPNMDLNALAQELLAAYAAGEVAAPPSSRYAGFDMTAAYAVEAELVRLRRREGRTTVGRKVGFANKAVWRILKLDTLAWAHMYDDTVHHSSGQVAKLALARRCSPRIEPEVVFKLKDRLPPESADPGAVLGAVEWLALGFEINDCVFPDWQFQPADFVAAFGFHTALVVGQTRPVAPGAIPLLADQLSRFKLRLLKNGHLVEEGSGKNSLRSPALCLAELAAAIARRAGAEPLGAGEIVSSGTLTQPQPVAPGEEWKAEVQGIDLPELSLRLLA